MTEKRKIYARRDFLKEMAAGIAVATSSGAQVAYANGETPGSDQFHAGVTAESHAIQSGRVQFPRTFKGRNLRMIAFPLGGIGTGTISLGGRGELRDWEIFNRPEKGNSLRFAFPAIWAKVGSHKPVARVLETRFQPPYERTIDGLGAESAPGLPRLADAIFTGAYPFAKMAFRDSKLPVEVSLEAFNPLVPLDVEASEWPMAVLRYTIRNPNPVATRVGIAWSIENPVGRDGRKTEFRKGEGLSGLYMGNPGLLSDDPLKGTCALCVLSSPDGTVSYLSGWKRANWRDGASSFWSDFADDGALESTPLPGNSVGSLAVTQDISAGRGAAVTFLISWHFPNRTPGRCGWPVCEGEHADIHVGNAYTERFADAWDVSLRAAAQLPQLEARSRTFAQSIEHSTLPPALLDAATSTLSTLRTNTCFRTADGEFHGFEGSLDQRGAYWGNCTHVWAYEYATGQMFPALARSLRESNFLRNVDARGLMGHRHYLPDGKQIYQRAVADGQMACIIKLYREWRLSGDTEWLRRLWPSAKRALEFAWIQDGWDADRSGVLKGCQHNTYDIEFYGPNPLGGVYYLAALRACEEMAQGVGDEGSAREYRRLFANGSRWTDENLFNGEYFIQKNERDTNGKIAEGLDDGSQWTNPPDEYQLGKGCMADQLLGQYHAHMAGLGYLVDESHVSMALSSIYKYNFKTDLSDFDATERTYAVNNEGGVLAAVYPSGDRERVPFCYSTEVWTGVEYQFAASLAFEGLMEESVAVLETMRQRYDGEKRNPWNEQEAGHHYARAMASWACFAAWSGFHYDAPHRELTLAPCTSRQSFQCFWSIPSGWGSYLLTLPPQEQRIKVQVAEGKITVKQLVMNRGARGLVQKVSARWGNDVIGAKSKQESPRQIVTFEREVEVNPDQPLEVIIV